MKRLLRVMQALVFGRTAILIVLALFYLIGAFIVVTLDPGRRGAAIGLFAIIPTAGFFGIATERATLYSTASGSLGIPDHARAIRQGQIGVAVLFLLVPVTVGVCFGGQLSWLMLLCVPAALGTLLARYPRWAFGMWIVTAVGGRMFSISSFGPLLQSLWFRVTLTAAGLAILGRWLGFAMMAEQRGKSAFSGLADRKHERSADPADEGLPGESGRLQRFLLEQGRLIDLIAAQIVDRGVTLSVLCAALAIDVVPRWRNSIRVVGLGWLVLAAARVMFRPGSIMTVFIAITALAGVQLLAGVNLVHTAWRNRGAEQRLLVLTPRWPGPQRVKRLFLQATLASQISPWMTWTLIVAPLGMMGWVEMKMIEPASLCLFAASCGGCGVVWIALAQRRAKEISVGRIALLLCSAIGAALSVGSLLMSSSWIGTVGLAMVLAPAVIGIAALSYRPLQFPVQRVDAT